MLGSWAQFLGVSRFLAGIERYFACLRPKGLIKGFACKVSYKTVLWGNISTHNNKMHQNVPALKCRVPATAPELVDPKFIGFILSENLNNILGHFIKLSFSLEIYQI